MAAVGSVQSVGSGYVNIDKLSLYQVVRLLIQKVRQAVVQFFGHYGAVIKSACMHLLGKNTVASLRMQDQNIAPVVLSQEQRGAYVQQVIAAINRAGLETEVVQRANAHVYSRNYCEYPRYSGCGTSYYFFLQELNELKAKSRQVLFELLPQDSKKSMNVLLSADKDFILDNVLSIVHDTYRNAVRLLEDNLFKFLNTPQFLKKLQFDRFDRREEITESAQSVFRARLKEPLKSRLHSFPPKIQVDLLNSAYCRLKKVKTGKGDEIDTL
ncbi:MAG: hypothetical protein JWO53_364 [Chlamydiia bacterium]|nr:hypothetical protein [Chlamydiia bacterium]